MIRVEFPQDGWELLLKIVDEHPSGYLAKNMANEIKNQIIRQTH